MLPNPLHPAIVHFPIVLAFLLPLIAAVGIWQIHRGTNPRRAWIAPLVAAVMLAASAWAAVETGEDQDERVERVVASKPLSAHEEMAETFLAGAAVLVLIASVGLVGGGIGRAARIVTAAGAGALLVAAARVGHSGGELVYRYGAAGAYTGNPGRDTATGSSAASPARAGSRSLIRTRDFEPKPR
jgi:hypothetical protein